MKKSTLLSAAAAMLILTSGTCFAVPLNQSNDAMDYMFKAPDLSRVSAGIYYRGQKRDLDVDGYYRTREMTEQRIIGYLGFDLFRWLNIFAVGGRTSVDLQGVPDGDGGSVFGGGISVNLLNHFIREPVPLEDAFRINLGVQSLACNSEFGSKTVRWIETSAALTFSIVNHIDGNKEYNPESIALYFGPAISLLHSSDLEAKTQAGAVGGIELFLTDSCSLDLRVEYFDNAGVSAGVNLRF